eukprot:TRINITY_DN7154_c0_g1_i3.p1 TRINITY_DN7154_c0_g1~~TRINITY_DN7154_c0_g1_i3.p1  ORF type:complete len:472 (-),score=77.67 TRINITY_DN7154_c0_g1_i3:21-1436(-)
MNQPCTPQPPSTPQNGQSTLVPDNADDGEGFNGQEAVEKSREQQQQEPKTFAQLVAQLSEFDLPSRADQEWAVGSFSDAQYVVQQREEQQRRREAKGNNKRKRDGGQAGQRIRGLVQGEDPNKSAFWMFMEQYYRDVTKEDLEFLVGQYDDILADPIFTLPPIGMQSSEDQRSGKSFSARKRVDRLHNDAVYYDTKGLQRRGRSKQTTSNSQQPTSEIMECPLLSLDREQLQNYLKIGHQLGVLNSQIVQDYQSAEQPPKQWLQEHGLKEILEQTEAHVEHVEHSAHVVHNVQSSQSPLVSTETGNVTNQQFKLNNNDSKFVSFAREERRGQKRTLDGSLKDRLRELSDSVSKQKQPRWMTQTPFNFYGEELNNNDGEIDFNNKVQPSQINEMLALQVLRGKPGNLGQQFLNNEIQFGNRKIKDLDPEEIHPALLAMVENYQKQQQKQQKEDQQLDQSCCSRICWRWASCT